MFNLVGDCGNSISATITDNATGAPITDAMVPAYTQVRIDSFATASGVCHTGCTDYQVDVNHTYVWADISTASAWNGTYSIGYVFGRNPNGSTAYWQVLDTHNSNSTGPNYFTLAYPGTYQFHIQAIIDRHPNCPDISDHTDIINITISVGDADSATNLGPNSCNGKVAKPIDPGKPINVTNGNMYVQQTDYRLPGIGEGLEITRTYNSKKQVAGVFGFGWSSILDESISAYGTQLLRLNLTDGRAVYLARSSTSAPYTPKKPLDFYGQILKNADNTYTLTFKDGRVHQFNTSGKLVSFADRNGNTISLTYTSGNPTTITDASGRTLTLTYDYYGYIGSIADSTGTIATYTHGFWGRLLGVAYADGSQFNFSDTFMATTFTSPA